MKKILAIVLSAAMLLMLVACGGGASTAAPASSAAPAASSAAPAEPAKPEKTTLVVGTSADYPPYEFIYLDDKGEQVYAGIDISVAEKLAEDAGLELEIVNMAFDNLMASLQKGELDVVIAAIEETPERLAVADFSDPYYTDLPPMLLVRTAEKDQYTSLESFAGKTVGAQSGTTKADLLMEQMPDADPLLLTAVTDLVNNLIYEKCDAVLIDGAMALSFASSNEDIVVADVALGESYPYCVAVQKGDPSELLDSFNKTIGQITTDGSIEAFIEEANELSEKAIL